MGIIIETMAHSSYEDPDLKELYGFEKFWIFLVFFLLSMIITQNSCKELFID